MYDVNNLVDHAIRLAMALAGLGMVRPSELCRKHPAPGL